MSPVPDFLSSSDLVRGAFALSSGLLVTALVGEADRYIQRRTAGQDDKPHDSQSSVATISHEQ